MEIFSLLNPHTKDLSRVEPGFESLKSIDVAHGLTFIRHRGARLLARVKYADQKSFETSLINELTKQLHKVAKRNKWKMRKAEFLESISKISVVVYCHHPKCKLCRGVGSRIVEDKKIVCPRCNGSTWERINSAELSRALEIDEHAYRATWRNRFSAAISALSDWDRDACKSMRRSLIRY